MRNGLFYLAERQKPQLAMHDKMETRLSDAQWLGLLGKATGASAGNARQNGNATF